MSSVNEQFLVNTLIIALGWLVRRYLVGEAEAVALVRITMNVTLPGLIISTFSTVHFHAALALLPLLAIAYGLLMATLGAFVLFRSRSRRERGQATFLLPSFNVGLFAYPLVESALGRGSLQYLAMFDMGVAVVTFVGTFAIASHYAREERRGLGLGDTAREMLRTVPLVVCFLTLVLNVAGVRTPGPVVQVSKVLAQANMPLALLVLGMYLRFDGAGARWSEVARILGLRYGIGLATGLALYFLLPYDPLFRTVLLAALLLPPPLISLSYAVQFGYDAPFVGLLLNVANVVSYFLLWGVFNLAGPGSGGLLH